MRPGALAASRWGWRGTCSSSRGCKLRGMKTLLSLGILAGALAGVAAPAAPKDPHGCLASGDGYLRARIRGALQLDINLHNSELECDGGPRPDGSGIRVSFAGPARSDGRRLRMVFGVARTTEGTPGRE